MLKLIKLLRGFENLSSIRYASSARFQFKVKTPVYYPKRAAAETEEQLKKPILVHEEAKNAVVPSVDYYKVLGLPKAASAQQIKTAYYDLAKKYHPDASPTPQETKSFQEISEAYHVLSDENTRLEYDRYGTVRRFQPFLKTIAEGDIVPSKGRKMPSLLKWLKGKGPEKEQQQVVALKDIPHLSRKNLIELNLKFLQAIHGGKEYVDLKTMVKCPRCNSSTRFGSPVNVEFCQKCGGTGQYRVRVGGDISFKICDCYDGKRLVNHLNCETCENRGFVIHSRRVEVLIPPGSANGDILKIPNPMNNQSVSVRLNVEKSSYFKRDGKNIITDKYITISQAVLGGKFRIRGLYEELELSLGPGVESHTTHRFRGKGITTHSAPAGDHIVVFKIRIPKSLTMKQRQLFLTLARNEDPTFDGQY